VKKHMTVMGAWLLVAVSLSGCSAEVDDSAPDGDAATASEELKNWGGTKPGSCLDRCLSLCPVDAQGGVEVGCLLTCFGACSSKVASASLAGTTAMTTLSP
jgi:hypothetical protein